MVASEQQADLAEGAIGAMTRRWKWALALLGLGVTAGAMSWLLVSRYEDSAEAMPGSARHLLGRGLLLGGVVGILFLLQWLVRQGPQTASKEPQEDLEPFF